MQGKLEQRVAALTEFRDIKSPEQHKHLQQKIRTTEAHNFELNSSAEAERQVHVRHCHACFSVHYLVVLVRSAHMCMGVQDKVSQSVKSELMDLREQNALLRVQLTGDVSCSIASIRLLPVCLIFMPSVLCLDFLLIHQSCQVSSALLGGLSSPVYATIAVLCSASGPYAGLEQELTEQKLANSGASSAVAQRGLGRTQNRSPDLLRRDKMVSPSPARSSPDVASPGWSPKSNNSLQDLWENREHYKDQVEILAQQMQQTRDFYKEQVESITEWHSHLECLDMALALRLLGYGTCLDCLDCCDAV